MGEVEVVSAINGSNIQNTCFIVHIFHWVDCFAWRTGSFSGKLPLGIRIEQQVQNYHLIHDHCCLNNSFNEHHQKRIFFLSSVKFCQFEGFWYRVTPFRC